MIVGSHPPSDQHSTTDASADGADAAAIPLCVDLDGTLIASDVVAEQTVSLVQHNPLALLRAAARLPMGGRAASKQFMASAGEVDVERLPYRREVLELVRREREKGRSIVLATGADEHVAKRIASHLGLFDRVIASDGRRNLKGVAKLEALREAFPGGFDYVGDAAADRPVFEAARVAYLVSPRSSLAAWARQNCPGSQLLVQRPPRLAALWRVMRPHQWVKNLLVLLPVVFSHQLGDRRHLESALVALFAFCAAASAIYVVNDALDVGHDRKHATKRGRPFASGALPLTWAAPLVGALLCAAAVAASVLPWKFALVLAGYALLSLAYSVWLKTRLLVDVIVLAALYTIRVVAGGVASGVVVSPWLFAFSMFMFTSLAFAKRYAELRAAMPDQTEPLPGRSYRTEDLHILLSVGPASGLVAVLVLAMYVNSDMVSSLYRTPALLWLVCPLLLYWTTRIWFFAARGALDEDPIVFAVRDRISWIALVLCGLVAVAAATIRL